MDLLISLRRRSRPLRNFGWGGLPLEISTATRRDFLESWTASRDLENGVHIKRGCTLDFWRLAQAYEKRWSFWELFRGRKRHPQLGLWERDLGLPLIDLEEKRKHLEKKCRSIEDQEGETQNRETRREASLIFFGWKVCFL